jgi:hypothetical protein
MTIIGLSIFLSTGNFASGGFSPRSSLLFLLTSWETNNALQLTIDLLSKQLTKKLLSTLED